MKTEEIKNKITMEIETLAGKTLKNPDQRIFENGYLDSINVLQIILFIEEYFKIKIDTFDLTLDTLGTVNLITKYIESKL